MSIKKSVKKVAFVGVIAMVVIGTVLAAGCTGTSSNPLSAITGDPIVGNWLASGAELQLNSDGTGTITEMGTIKSPATWKKTGDNTYYIEPYLFTSKLSSDGKTLETNGRYYTTFKKV